MSPSGARCSTRKTRTRSTATTSAGPPTTWTRRTTTPSCCGPAARENHTVYSNPKFDALCDAADVSQNPAKRSALYRQAARIAADDVPIIPLYYQQDVELIKPYVSGIDDGLMGHLPVQTPHPRSGAIVRPDRKHVLEIAPSVCLVLAGPAGSDRLRPPRRHARRRGRERPARRHADRPRHVRPGHVPGRRDQPDAPAGL